MRAGHTEGSVDLCRLAGLREVAFICEVLNEDGSMARLPVSIAEIGDVERYQVATLGVAVVSGDSGRCSEVLSHAASMAGNLSDALLADVATEIVSFGAGGSNLRGGIEQAFETRPDLDLDDDDLDEDR